MERAKLIVRYAIHNLWREKQRSAFALLCVAAGVAAIVALQTLGLAIGEALTSNARAANRGDVAVVLESDEFFTPAQMAAFDRLVADGTATGSTVRYRTQMLPISVAEGDHAGQGLMVEAFLVDPAVYPLYGEIRALDPAGALLADLLSGPNDAVIGKSLADRNGIAVGDHLQVGAGQEARRVTVRGIVPSTSAAAGSNLAPLLVGFVYLDYHWAVESLALEETASELFFTVELESAATVLAERAAAIAPAAGTRTAGELLAQNEQVSNAVRPLVTIVGLMALLIGGLGIANTMLVIVARRRPEIAVLKALGLKGRQVAAIMVAESALLGLAGSLLGLPLGLGTGQALLSLAAEFVALPPRWHAYPLALVTGLVVGVLVSITFGLLPALAVARIRPSAVLQPADGRIPRSGRWQTLGVVLLLTAAMGLLAGWILESPALGLAGAYGTLVVLALLIGLLWAVVWVVERLPGWGWMPLHLAQRSIGRNRSRAASTLLALILGLLSISLVTILGASLIDMASSLITSTVGADLLVPARADETTRAGVLGALAATPGIVSFAETASFSSELVAINDDRQALQQHLALYEQEYGAELATEQRHRLAQYFGAISARQLDSNLPALEFAPGKGRNLTPADTASPLILLPGSDILQPLGLQPGDWLIFRLENGAEVSLEIVGISQTAGGTVTMGGTVMAPLGVLLPLAEPRSWLTLVSVDPAQKDETVTALAARLPPGAAILETAAFVEMFGELFRQLALLPVLVTTLTLFAAATMIANSMALATMERQREIGVMKAVGVKANHVLLQLLLESAILALVGSAIGIGLVVVVTVLLRALLSETPATVNPWVILALFALAVAVSLGATLVAAWPASRRRPLEVLRYE